MDLKNDIRREEKRIEALAKRRGITVDPKTLHKMAKRNVWEMFALSIELDLEELGIK